MLKQLRPSLFLFFLIASILFIPLGCTTSDSGLSNTPSRVIAKIGPDGGLIRHSTAGGSPEIEIPPGTLRDNAVVMLDDLDTHSIAPENEDVEVMHPMRLTVQGGQPVPGAQVIIRYRLSTDSATLSGEQTSGSVLPGETQTRLAIGISGNEIFSAYPCEPAGDRIEGTVALELDNSSDDDLFVTEISALEIPVIGEASPDPPMKVSRLVNDQWMEDETQWTGTKIALMVHGINGSSADLRALAIHLNENHAYDAIYAVDYKLGYHIDTTGTKLASIIDSRTPAGVKIEVFAHSMGGLVSRSALENHGAATDAGIQVTMGSPHEGVTAAYLLSLITKKFVPGIVPELEDLSPDSDFLKELNDGVPVTSKYYTAYGTDGQKLTVYWTEKYFGVTLVKILLGDVTVDGMVAAYSAGYDLSKECSYFEKLDFPVSHAYIRGGDYGSPLYSPVMEQIDEWVNQN